MNETSVPKLSKLPFLIGDLLLLLVAGWLVWHSATLDAVRITLVVAAVAIGAWLAVAPFIIQFRADVQRAQTAQLADATTQLGDLQALASQISGASSVWQQIQKSTGETVASANQIADRMIAESKSFGEVISKANEVEKQHLRLELDKLRRSEGEWLQVVVRLFDHTFALHRAGVRSGQRSIADQLSHFQNACREVARRVGFMSIVPRAGDAFDEQQHQVLDGQAKTAGAPICEIVAPGYTFQGQLLRLPVVGLKPEAPAPENADPVEPQLPLGDMPSDASAAQAHAAE